MTATATRPRQLEPAEVRDAWAQYLADTHDVEPVRYAEVERWAWSRLREKLDELDRKRKVAA